MPVEYGVERIREGRTFLTRRVTAYQGGDAIFEASVGFTLPEEGISHQQPMPGAPDPEGQPPWWETINAPTAPPMMRRRRWITPIDIRSAGDAGGPGNPDLPHRAVWARTYAPLPEDPIIHAAAMAYMSDSGMVGTVANHYRMWNQGTASLDHSIWWHHPPRFDGWLLYVNDSPAGHAARAVIFGGIWNQAGVRAASVAQEGLFRRASPGSTP
jgi:acyl-CoA thioesterase-2